MLALDRRSNCTSHCKPRDPRWLSAVIVSIQVGKKADIVIVNENPIRNFKVLYGTGHKMLDQEKGEIMADQKAKEAKN